MRSLTGATIWARKTIESDIFVWKPAEWFKIWFYIITTANYADNRQFDRGSNFYTYQEISEATKATRDQVDKFVRWAKKQKMATTRKTTRGFVISLDKYDKYQDLDNYKSDTESETEAKQKRNRSDTIKEIRKKGSKEVLTTLASAAPSPEASPKVRTPLQEVVDHFFDLLGLDPSQRSVSYPRHVRDAQALLKACGGDAKKACGILDALHAWAAGKKLTYTIGTALKQWQRFSSVAPSESYEVKMARVQAEIDKYQPQQK